MKNLRCQWIWSTLSETPEKNSWKCTFSILYNMNWTKFPEMRKFLEDWHLCNTIRYKTVYNNLIYLDINTPNIQFIPFDPCHYNCVPAWLNEALCGKTDFELLAKIWAKLEIFHFWYIHSKSIIPNTIMTNTFFNENMEEKKCNGTFSSWLAYGSTHKL